MISHNDPGGASMTSGEVCDASVWATVLSATTTAVLARGANAASAGKYLKPRPPHANSNGTATNPQIATSRKRAPGAVAGKTSRDSTASHAPAQINPFQKDRPKRASAY